MALPSPKRQRPIRSCLSCRTRRVKCDQVSLSKLNVVHDVADRSKVHPACSNCTKTGRLCRYDYGETEAYQTSHGGQSSAASPAISRATSNLQIDSTEDMGHMHRSLGGRTRYIGPSFWGISDKDVSKHLNYSV